uniref:D-ribitol-5-phosphate cytidylyltransferase n=1 Tax=uncultured Methanobrevibacter sp. TaxID=253161 RepID=UPI0025FC3B51
MNFALILAGGFGTRMGETEKPKQFLTLGTKPILIHTVEKFAFLPDFEKIIVLTPKEWINYTNDLIKEYIPLDNVVVIEGGELRIDTINEGMEYILNNYGGNDHIIVTHDAVRPFVSHRIIKDNIKQVEEVGACDT